MIGILNYGSGNLFSLYNAFNKIHNNVKLLSDEREILNCSTLILPGVGSFKSCIEKISNKDLISKIYKYIEKGDRLLGICVGMQLLMHKGEENGITEGLKVIDGSVTILKPSKYKKINNLPLPNIGWSTIEITNNNYKKVFFNNIKKNEFYFAHSYGCRVENLSQIVAFNTYGSEKYPSMIRKDNIIGIQFHPEKSGDSGLKLLRNILAAK